VGNSCGRIAEFEETTRKKKKKKKEASMYDDAVFLK